jgi:hypothetical protein
MSPYIVAVQLLAGLRRLVAWVVQMYEFREVIAAMSEPILVPNRSTALMDCARLITNLSYLILQTRMLNQTSRIIIPWIFTHKFGRILDANWLYWNSWYKGTYGRQKHLWNAACNIHTIQTYHIHSFTYISSYILQHSQANHGMYQLGSISFIQHGTKNLMMG